MKKGIAIFALVLALVIIVPVAFIIMVDPNMFGPAIKDKAKQHGVALEMGDLSWAFWPRLAIKVSDLSAAALDASDSPLIAVEHASFSLDVMPVFKKQFHVNHIQVSAANIQLAIDENGRGNWQSIVDANASSNSGDNTPTATPSLSPTEAEKNTSPINLNIEKIQLSDSSFSFLDAQAKQSFTAKNIQFEVNDVNLNGSPIQIHVAANNSLVTQGAGVPSFNLNAALDATMQMAEDFSALSVSDGQMNANLQREGIAAQDINLNFSAQANKLDSDPEFSADLSTNTLNLRALLAIFDVDFSPSAAHALTKFSLSAKVNGNTSTIDTELSKLQLDSTNIQGQVAMTMATSDSESPVINAVFRGDKINVDDYLPQSAEEEPSSSEPSNTDEPLIPVDLLHSLQAKLTLDFQEIRIAKADISNLHLEASVGKGVAKISSFKAKAFGGEMQASSMIDARGQNKNNPATTFKTQINDLKLEPIYKWLELPEKANFTGAVLFDLEGSTKGATTGLVQKNLNANAQLTGKNLRFYPLNIEQQLCKIADLVSGEKSPEANWNDYTELTSVVGEIRITDEILSIEQLDAYIANLVLDADGTFDLNKDNYRVNLPLKLQEKTDSSTAKSEASTKGCHLQSKEWLNKTMSLLVCKGSITALDPTKDCRPDKSAVEKYVKEYAKSKFKEKHGDKIDAEKEKLEQKKEEATKKLEEKLKESDPGKKIESKLKDLFGK